MNRKIYEYDGKEFTSVQALAEYVGVNPITLGARLRRGISIAEACDKKDFRCNYNLDGNTYKSVSQICKDHEKNGDLVRNRLKYGYSLNDALNKPKNVTRQGKPIVVDGVLYNSVKAALRAKKLMHKEHTVRRRLKSGMKPDFAFDFDEEK